MEKEKELNYTQIILSYQEKIKNLEEINDRLKKVLYVYEKSMEPESNYNYKVFCSGLLIYISSSNFLFDGELVSLVVNINSILTNNFKKSDIKRIVFESINFTNHLIKSYKIKQEEQEKKEKESNKDSHKESKEGTFWA